MATKKEHDEEEKRAKEAANDMVEAEDEEEQNEQAAPQKEDITPDYSMDIGDDENGNGNGQDKNSQNRRKDQNNDKKDNQDNDDNIDSSENNENPSNQENLNAKEQNNQESPQNESNKEEQPKNENSSPEDVEDPKTGEKEPGTSSKSKTDDVLDENMNATEEAEKKAAEEAEKKAAEEAEKKAVEEAGKKAIEEEAIEGAEATAGAAAGGGALAAAGIVILIILIIIAIIGIISFIVTGLPLLWNKIKDIAGSLWDGLEGYVIGRDSALVKQEDIIGAAQYIYDMGYDLVGMGFAESVQIYGEKDENGHEIEVEEGHQKNEIKKVDAPFLRAYLVAENRTYLVNNFTFNLKDFFGSIFDFSMFTEGDDVWGTGLINLDNNIIETLFDPAYGLYLGDWNVGELVKGVKIDRKTNQMRIRRTNWGVRDIVHNDYTYYNLEGWSGRYGKPFELLLTLHIATMAPDLVKEFALNKDLDAKVNIKLKKTEFNGNAYINGQAVNDLLNETVTEEVVTGHDEDTGEEITETQTSQKYTGDTRKELENVQYLAEQVKTSIPYISSVTHHWFRNVYFEGTDSYGASSSTEVGVDKTGNRDEETGKEKPDGIEDYKEEKGPKTQITRKLSADDNVYKFGESNEEKTISTTKTITGMEGNVEFKGTMDTDVIQIKDAVRGKTNQTTKKLFNKKYYIYDGTIEKAKEINEDRKSKKNSSNLKDYIKMSNESLSAFTILEGSETLDAQYIYRDLKELVIELGYFEREDFDVIEKKILEWPIPDYTPNEWPERKTDKQVLEYGTLISSEATVANSLGLTLEEYREIKNMNKENEENNTGNDSDVGALSNTLFIGDSYIEGLKSNVSIDNAQYFAKSGQAPKYFLDNVKSLPANASQVCVYMGVNDPSQIDAMKGFIESISQKYKNANIYIIEVMHLGQNYHYNDVDKTNSSIDVFNAQIREKCKKLNNVCLIDASQGLVSGGYLAHPDGEGIHMQSSDYSKWAENIAKQIKRVKNIASSTSSVGGEVQKKAKKGDGYSELVIYNSKIYKHYLQGSGSWSSYRFPDRVGCSIASNGCGITAAANVLSAYQQTANITPEETAKATIDEMKTSKHYWPMCDDIANAMTKLGVKAEAFEREDTSKTASNIKTALDEGREVIVRISSGDDHRYTDGIHYVTLIKYEEGEGISIINSSGNSDNLNFYEGTLEEFIDAYMPKKGAGNGYLITQEKSNSVVYNGFEPDEDVIAMGNGKIVEILNEGNNLFSEETIREQIGGEKSKDDKPTIDNPSVGLVQDGVRIKLTDVALKGYTLVIYGIKLDESIKAGDTVKATDVIGKTREDSDICLVLIDRDKAIIEDIENYIKVPEVKKEEKEKLLGGNAEEKVWIALKQAGYTDEAIAGVMGNIFGESGFRADAVEAGSGEGIGLCQWSFGRRKQLEAYAASKGVSWQDEDTQIEFLLAELTPGNTGGGAEAYAEYQFFAPYDKYKTQWENAKNSEEASVAFRMGFERPGESTARDQARIDAANRYYELYKNKY